MRVWRKINCTKYRVNKQITVIPVFLYVLSEFFLMITTTINQKNLFSLWYLKHLPPPIVRTSSLLKTNSSTRAFNSQASLEFCFQLKTLLSHIKLKTQILLCPQICLNLNQFHFSIYLFLLYPFSTCCC